MSVGERWVIIGALVCKVEFFFLFLDRLIKSHHLLTRLVNIRTNWSFTGPSYLLYFVLVGRP